MQGNGCSRPAGAIDALRLCAGALWVQHGNGCSRPAGAIGVLVVLCWWLWVQPASGGYRGAGGSVLVAMGAACQRWLWVQHGTDAAGQRWGVFFVFCCFLFCFLLVFPRFRKLIAIKINIPTYNTAFYIIFYIFLGILKLR